MSNNTNTQLADELEDLTNEVADCQSSYDSDLKYFKDAQDSYRKSELNLYKAKVALLEFKQKLYNDN